MNDPTTQKTYIEAADVNSPTAASPAKSEPNEVPEWLGSQLKQLFTDVMQEPLPDELMSLLRQLEDKERR